MTLKKSKQKEITPATISFGPRVFVCLGAVHRWQKDCVTLRGEAASKQRSISHGSQWSPCDGGYVTPAVCAMMASQKESKQYPPFNLPPTLGITPLREISRSLWPVSSLGCYVILSIITVTWGSKHKLKRDTESMCGWSIQYKHSHLIWHFVWFCFVSCSWPFLKLLEVKLPDLKCQGRLHHQ